MKLSEAKEETFYQYVSFQGSESFQRRAVPMGLVSGTKIYIMRNQKKMPILIFARDTIIAVNRKDAEGIEVIPFGQSRE